MKSEVTAMQMVKDYYGVVLKSQQDLKTTACCAADAGDEAMKALLAKIHPAVLAKFYGCGVPIPPAVEGLHVLDLGSGSGRDCYLLSALVGEHGQVTGVDMTEAQLATAREYQEYHRQAFGYATSNVVFKHGYIEDLQACGIPDASQDLVVSNCVINLSPRKEMVFKEILRVLKPGGELYFSDVFADRRIPEELRQDPVLLGECLSGAMYIEDFRRLLQQLGCHDYRVVKTAPIEVMDAEIREKLGETQFLSLTIRAFKLDLEDRCEDYGQTATYLGNLGAAADGFTLDDHHSFAAQQPLPVCKNTAQMLSQSRYQRYFSLAGEGNIHRGLFQCHEETTPVTAPATGGCC
ncbi:MAG: methyltransferase domain-containing protein [Zetaproteobacteria bacterium]|nr:methyltransferase domain-containing protein [Zetaproteobacteria bacterium]